MKNIVLIGGGTGMPSLLRGLKKHECELTAVVNVTDSGRSSGKIREEMGILPPGDIRNCIAALSESESVVREVFQYRFENGDSLGNLMIAALSDIFGSFESAIEEVGKILNIKGMVLPVTLKNVHLCAELQDGEIRVKEHNVRGIGKAKINKVYLDKKAYANPVVLEAIKGADLIVLGPGSLYTSIISNLLVDGVADAIVKSKAKKVYVCNIMTQAGQTDDFTSSTHVSELVTYLGADCLDYVLVNSNNFSDVLLENYRKESASPVVDDLNRQGLIRGDFVEMGSQNQVFWHKQNLLWHDSKKIAEVIVKL